MSKASLDDVIDSLTIYAQTFGNDIFIRPYEYDKFRKDFFDKVVNETYCNGSTIFLPSQIEMFDSIDSNHKMLDHFLHQGLSHLIYGSFDFEPSQDERFDKFNFENLEEFYNLFGKGPLVEDLFNIFEKLRTRKLLLNEFLGLKNNYKLCDTRLYRKNKGDFFNSEKERFVQYLNQKFGYEQDSYEPLDPKLSNSRIIKFVDSRINLISSVEDSALLAIDVSKEMQNLNGSYSPIKLSSTRLNAQINKKKVIAKQRERRVIKELGIGGPRKRGSFGPSRRRGRFGTGRGIFREKDDRNRGHNSNPNEEGFRVDEVQEGVTDELLRRIRFIGIGEEKYQLNLTSLGIEDFEADMQVEFRRDIGELSPLWTRVLKTRIGESPRWSNEYVNPNIRTSQIITENQGRIRRLEEFLQIFTNIEEEIIHGERDGEDIDFDAYTDLHAEILSGAEIEDDPRIYTRKVQREGEFPISSALLLGMSLSSGNYGCIDVRRNSAVLFAKAFENVGLDNAVYGLSGRSKGLVEFYQIKEFNDSTMSPITQRSFEGISPQDFCRVGAGIRQTAHRFNKQEINSERKIIFVYAGMPEDINWGQKVSNYLGENAIFDVQDAIRGVNNQGFEVKSFYDNPDDKENMIRMYGKENVTFVDSENDFVLGLEKYLSLN